MVDSAPQGAPAAQGDDTLRLVCFRLHAQELAVEITEVKETMVVRPITRVFLAPPHLAGIINLRGDIVAIIDLGRLIGLGPADIRDASRIVIVRHGDVRAGIVVDELAELRAVPRRAIEPPPATLSPDEAALLRGVITTQGGAPVGLLHVPSLLDPERLRLRSPQDR